MSGPDHAETVISVSSGIVKCSVVWFASGEALPCVELRLSSTAFATPPRSDGTSAAERLDGYR